MDGGASGFITRLDQLIALFNRRSLDLPDGLFSRDTQFVLNGVSFEARLGRAEHDPLVRMLTRGAAGYRFAVKALQHAVPDAVLERGEVSRIDATTARGRGWLSGHSRGDAVPLHILAAVEWTLRGETVERVAVDLDPDALEILQAARLRA